MTIDYSGFALPKPTKAGKKSSFRKKAKKELEQERFTNEIDIIIAFYESSRGDMASVENYRYTKKLRNLVLEWIDMVMASQRCELDEVLLAWQATVVHAAEKVHASHKVGSFMNMFWIIKNDHNYLDILEGKYDKEFRKREKKTAGWGDPSDFGGVQNDGSSGIIV